MKVELTKKTTIQGYSKLFGVDYHRLKARSKRPTTGTHTATLDAILKEKGEYYSEYRLVKEKDGFIWWEVLADHGINGYHTTVKKAITTSIHYVDIYIDEPFEHADKADFKKIENYHKNRERGCQHKNTEKKYGSPWCWDCGTHLPAENQ